MAAAATHRQLPEVLGRLGWPTEQGIRRGTRAGLRVMLVNDYDRLSQIVDADVRAIPAGGPNAALSSSTGRRSWRVR